MTRTKTMAVLREILGLPPDPDPFPWLADREMSDEEREILFSPGAMDRVDAGGQARRDDGE